MGGIMKDGNANPITTSNPLAVGGNTAHDAAVTGNPQVVAGRAINTTPTGVSATNDTSYIQLDMTGKQVTKPYSIPEADWQFASAAITTAVDTAVKAAGAAGVRNYVTGLQFINTGATATEVVVKDGSTVIWRSFAPANMTNATAIQFHTPLRGTAATAMNFGVVTAAANVYASAQGYQAP